MASSKNKTVPSGASVEEFLDGVEHPVRRVDGLALQRLMQDWTGWQPQMWGPSIVGFGRYHYRYASGRDGDFLVTGFSPRKANLVIYVMPGYRDMGEKLARLGKHRTGSSCLYITRLDVIDIEVLKEIVLDGVAYMKAHYELFAV